VVVVGPFNLLIDTIEWTASTLASEKAIEEQQLLLVSGMIGREWREELLRENASTDKSDSPPLVAPLKCRFGHFFSCEGIHGLVSDFFFNVRARVVISRSTVTRYAPFLHTAE
jgi:hypothetical protein